MRLAQPSQCMSTLSTAVTMGGGFFPPSLSFPFAPFSCWSFSLSLSFPFSCSLSLLPSAGDASPALGAAGACSSPSSAGFCCCPPPPLPPPPPPPPPPLPPRFFCDQSTPLVHYTIHRPGGRHGVKNKNRD